MPFGLYDPGGTLLQDLKAADISAIVLLAEIEECREKTGRDLLAVYREEGLTVFPLPTPNYGIPSNSQLADVLKQARARASDGHNVLIHCSAGLGRTALFAALAGEGCLGAIRARNNRMAWAAPPRLPTDAGSNPYDLGS
jgi:hypothetical protein